MHVQRDVSQVRSQRNTWSASAGSANSTRRGEVKGYLGHPPSLGRRRHAIRTGGSVGACASAVLDVGASTVSPARGRRAAGGARRRSNTVHLLVVDAHAGPAAGRSSRRPSCGSPSTSAATARRDAARAPHRVVRQRSRSPRTRAPRTCSAFATSALREAPNGDEVLDRGPRGDRRRPPGPHGRRRGAPDLPGRTSVVRLVGRPAAGARHRWRVARGRRRHRRGARR